MSMSMNMTSLNPGHNPHKSQLGTFSLPALFISVEGPFFLFATNGGNCGIMAE
jgi:hypothetical protein